MSTEGPGAKALTAVLCACALIVTALVVRREVFPPSPQLNIPDRIVENWDELSSRGYSASPASNPGLPVLLVFTDFQCPACKQFHETTVREAVEGLGDAVIIRYRHWPLPYHPDALAAALAAECAGQQGRFHQFADSLFAHQAELGSLNFIHQAFLAGVPDSTAFAACLKSETTRTTVSSDREIAESLGSQGTPTVLLDGLLLGSIPDSAGLVKRLRDIRHGE